MLELGHCGWKGMFATAAGGVSAEVQARPSVLPMGQAEVAGFTLPSGVRIAAPQWGLTHPAFSVF